MTPLNRIRRYTLWSVVGGGVVIVGLATALDLISDDRGPARTALLGAAVVVVLVQHVRYLRQAVDGRGRGEHRPWEHLATFLVALAAWAASLGPSGSTAVWSLLPAAVIAHVAAVHPHPWRWVVVLGGTTLVLGAGAVSDTPDLADQVAVPLVMIGVLVFADLAQLWVWDLTRQLEQARRAEQALAVAEERLRFAADLHDIQGHHLQAIALKGELAQRLVGRDDDAARLHAGEVAELARTALRETREVVQGYRRASLDTEIANAVGVLRAAGIETAVHGDAAEVPPPLQPLFGALVREGTTNVLRHSRARRCDVRISVADGQVSVLLHNDGARADGAVEPGAGLAGLRERFATVGGRVEAGRVEAGRVEVGRGEAGPAGGEGFELVGRVGVHR